MQLLQKVASFTSSKEDKKCIYISYIRSILEQSYVVWHSSLTIDNSNDLERVQKAACKIILGNQYINYEQALNKLSIDSLKIRRKKLSRRFALKCLNNDKTYKLFPLNNKKHCMKTKNFEHFKVNFANTKRFQNSAIPQMQRLLNQEENL